MSQIATVGLDLAKQVFQVHAVTVDGTLVVRRQLSSSEMLQFLGGIPPCLVGMEAGASIHHWGRKHAEFCHDVA